MHLCADDDNEMATENAIAALGKVLEYCSDAIDSAAVASSWLQALPLTADAVEAVEQHELLAKLLATRDPRILGPGNSHVPKIASIIVTVLGHGTRLVSGEVGLQLAQQLHGLQPPGDLVHVSLEPVCACTWASRIELWCFPRHPIDCTKCVVSFELDSVMSIVHAPHIRC